MTIDINIPPGELPPNFFGVIHSSGQTSGRRLPPGGKQVSLADATYLAVSAAGENHREPGRTIWCMIRRFVGMWSKENSAGTSIKRLVELFSQPVNPAWAYISTWLTGSRQIPGTVLNRGNPDLQVPGPPAEHAVRKAVNAYRLSRGEAAPYPISEGLTNTFTDSARWRTLTGTSRQEVRQRNIRRAQLILQGGSEARRQWGGILPEARRAIYTILRGGSGPPAGFINGFDNFASVGGNPRWITNFWELSDELQESHLRDPEYLSARVGRSHRAIRFVRGGEYYIWRSFGRNWNYGDPYIVGPDGNSLGQTGELFNSSTEDRRSHSRVSVPGSSVVSTDASTSSTISSGESTGGGYVQTTTTEATSFDTWNVLDEPDINNNLRIWAEDTKRDLARIYRGRRRVT